MYELLTRLLSYSECALPRNWISGKLDSKKCISMYAIVTQLSDKV